MRLSFVVIDVVDGVGAAWAGYVDTGVVAVAVVGVVVVVGVGVSCAGAASVTWCGGDGVAEVVDGVGVVGIVVGVVSDVVVGCVVVGVAVDVVLLLLVLSGLRFRWCW